MGSDPIVEEIHEIRRKTMEECGNDPQRYFARLRAAEAREKAHRILKPPRPRRRPAVPSH